MRGRTGLRETGRKGERERRKREGERREGEGERIKGEERKEEREGKGREVHPARRGPLINVWHSQRQRATFRNYRKSEP